MYCCAHLDTYSDILPGSIIFKALVSFLKFIFENVDLLDFTNILSNIPLNIVIPTKLLYIRFYSLILHNSYFEFIVDIKPYPELFIFKYNEFRSYEH